MGGPGVNGLAPGGVPPAPNPSPHPAERPWLPVEARVFASGSGRHGDCTRPDHDLGRHGLEAIAVIEVATDHAFHLGNVLLGDSAQRRHEVEHGLVGERADELAFAAGGDDPGPPHLLQVLRRVGDRAAGSLRQDLDAPLALGQLLQEFEPMRVRQRFGDGRELGEQRHGTEVL